MELIKVNQNEKGQSVVSARDLHAFLGNKRQFSDWIKQRISDYGFEENKDYTTFSQTSEKGRPTIEYAITIDMAKELSMVERTEKGKQARQYFIEIDKQKKDLDLLTHEEVLQLTMLVKCFSYLENCVYAEQMNMSKFVEQSKAKNKAYAEFHMQRNRILQLDTDTINKRLNEFCIEHQRSYTKGLTKREKLAIMDKYEILKSGVWDYLTFKGSEHALKLANLCKEMAKITNGEMYKENKTDLFRLQDSEANVLRLNS